MSDAILHKAHHYNVPSLDLSLTPDLAQTFRIATKFAGAYEASVLLLGGTGSGKGRIARFIHDSSDRAKKPFHIIDLSQSTESVFESEIFGHEKGSFTGASNLKRGLFELADESTVFLDEIGTLSFDLQAKLLRLVQEKTLRRVGGTEDIKVDVRIIAATSLDLEEEVRNGKFRKDLFYRLNVLQIRVPSLCDRPSDILPLAEYFLKQASIKQRLSVKTLSDEARKELQSYDWPGNVRDLESEMTRALVTADGNVIMPADLSFYKKADNVFQLLVVKSNPPQLVLPQDKNAYADVIQKLSVLKNLSDVIEVCNEAKRYLLHAAVFKNEKNSDDVLNGDAASFLNCRHSFFASCRKSLFKLSDSKFPSFKNALPQWEEERLDHPFAALAQSIADIVLKEYKGGAGTKDMVKVVEDDVMLPGRMGLYKATIIRHNFSLFHAAKDLDLSDGYFNSLTAIDADFASWLAQSRALKTIEQHQSVTPHLAF